MTERFRSLPVKTHQLRVDREKRVIFGVSVAQAVEALGHDVAFDQKSLDQLVSLGNANSKGIKSRFTHPGLSADGLGKYLGRLHGFRTEGDKALADLHLSALAAKSPDGDLAGYVMDMAESEPDMFGMSVVVDMSRVWMLEGGEEIAVNMDEDDDIPLGVIGDFPLARIQKFIACDAVDEPAANRDGLFSSSLWATNQDAEKAFTQLDEILSEWGVSFDKAYSVALRYFDARGVKVRQETKIMSEKTEAQPVTAQQFTELQQQFNQVKDALAASEAKRAETEQEAKRFADALDKSNARIAAMEATDQRRRFSELCKDWFGKTEANVNLLVKMADALGEDSQEFKDHVTSQNAIAAQLAESKLFVEIGTSRSADNAGTPGGKIESMARQIATERKLSFAMAMSAAAEEHPDLYNEYVNARRKGA